MERMRWLASPCKCFFFLGVILAHVFPEQYVISPFKALRLIISCVSICGATAYWYIWAKLVPGMRGRRLEERAGILSDGTTYTKIVSI